MLEIYLTPQTFFRQIDLHYTKSLIVDLTEFCEMRESLSFFCNLHIDEILVKAIFGYDDFIPKFALDFN